ncbi:PQQ-binding-like beta-propeller repeat protein [Pseudooceanicola nanhaiensis]|uniref:PQQ-binding-like beta-propeller repeat protein n=1 Tax=Pseudooceanicola nanhaiensis TaxID=375761 RepID=UPI001CD1BC2A|nr:PQQ-binding-like beta-propeller repeat protein [Pseudooceanicola nanhaiensis]MCA0921168.1 PQQ-binding-like beta-propeller repeat protein [Pseudooceanicola nanhaiensis]
MAGLTVGLSGRAAQAQDVTLALFRPALPLSLAIGHPPAPGILTFRGRPDRAGHATGSLPRAPRVLWRAGPYCGPSTDQHGTRTWCGTGWTGQPAIRPRPDGRVEVIFGAYDHAVHFLDGATGMPVRAAFRTGDIVKGSVSLDPEGLPLLYTGSRDDYLRVLRLGPERAEELWRLNGNAPDGIWNNDWDASPLILGDWMFQGGENGWFHVIRLNRHRDAQGRIAVTPELVNRIAGFTPALFAAVGDRAASIENSTMALNGTVWFANSAGLVQGHDIAALTQGRPRDETLVMEWRAGDDIDATLVGGPEGEVYIAVEDERRPSPDKALSGHLARLDPSRPDAPLVWSLTFEGSFGGDGGVWATPALHAGHLYVPTHAGGLYTVEAATGLVTDRRPAPAHGWSSAVVVGGQLLLGTCSGDMVAYSLADPARPKEVWRFHPPGAGCWESTPAVWDGVIYVGNRNGYVYAIGESAEAMLVDVGLQ